MAITMSRTVQSGTKQQTVINHNNFYVDGAQAAEVLSRTTISASSAIPCDTSFAIHSKTATLPFHTGPSAPLPMITAAAADH